MWDPEHHFTLNFVHRQLQCHIDELQCSQISHFLVIFCRPNTTVSQPSHFAPQTAPLNSQPLTISISSQSNIQSCITLLQQSPVSPTSITKLLYFISNTQNNEIRIFFLQLQRSNHHAFDYPRPRNIYHMIPNCHIPLPHKSTSSAPWNIQNPRTTKTLSSIPHTLSKNAQA
jgi:hypothetical protein